MTKNKKTMVMSFNGSDADIEKVNSFIKDKPDVNIYSLFASTKKVTLIIEWVEGKK